MEEQVVRKETGEPKEEKKQEEEESNSEEKKETETEKKKTEEVENENVNEKKPWTKWTKKDRKQHLRNRRHSGKDKGFILILFSILVVIPLSAVFYSISSQQDPLVIITLIIILALLLITGIFFVNHTWHDTE